MKRNLATSLKRRSRGHPMDSYDRLPAELRRWLAQAALPWSAPSALRLWTRAMREASGDAAAARARMDRAEAAMLAKDAGKIWGRLRPRNHAESPPPPGKTPVRPGDRGAKHDDPRRRLPQPAVR